MTIRIERLGGAVGSDWQNGEYLYAPELIDTIVASQGHLGEVKMFALSISGAVTKSKLQSNGWAICDGTTSASQGITGATITTTPDLQERFIRMSDDETSGTTGGESTHVLTIAEMPAHTHDVKKGAPQFNQNEFARGDFSSSTQVGVTESTGGGSPHENKPPFYELAFFIRVKL